MSAAQPLAGVKILSLAEQLPGPFATALLSDLGAEVIQIERPPSGDPARQYPDFHAAVTRGKSSVALDLKTQAGRLVFEQLVRGVDVLVEGMRPGAMERLGLGPRQLRPLNERLVYVSVSAYGHFGRNSARPNHDLGLQALVGLLDPVFVGTDPPAGWAPLNPVADLCTALYTVVAIVVALRDAEVPGRPRFVDVAMADCLQAWMTPMLARMQAYGSAPIDPGYGVYPSRDGQRVALCIARENPSWSRLCGVLGLPELAGLSAIDRSADHDRLVGILAAQIAQWRAAALLERLTAEAVPCELVRDISGAVDAIVTSDRAMVVRPPVDDEPLRAVRVPIVFDGVPVVPSVRVPEVGADTAEVLARFGVRDDLTTALLGMA